MHVSLGDCELTLAATAHATQAGVLGEQHLAQGGAFASLTGTGDLASGSDDENIYGGLLGNEVGSGSGVRGTGIHGNVSAVPKVSIGQPVVAQVDADKAIIRRYIKRSMARITFCYVRILVAKPAIAGTVTVKFTISPEGTVTDSAGTGVDTDVASCVADMIAHIEFPKPRGGGDVKVTYPFMFQPPPDWDPKQKPRPSPPLPPPPPAVRPAPAPPAPHDSPPPVEVDAPATPASVPSPLSSRVTDLEHCLASRAQASGDANIELVIDDKGAITSANTTGVDGDAAMCVSAIARAVAFEGPARTLRCPLHYAR